MVAAEEVGASLAAALPPMPAAAPRARSRWTARPWATLVATAAAVIFAVTAAIEGVAVHGASTRLAQRDTALIALAGSHFEHVSLTPVTSSNVVAKAIYARDGAWYYVIAENAGPNAHVVVRTGDQLHDAGTLGPTSPAALFVRNPGRVQEFQIVANGTVVARAAPTY